MKSSHCAKVENLHRKKELKDDLPKPKAKKPKKRAGIPISSPKGSIVTNDKSS